MYTSREELPTLLHSTPLSSRRTLVCHVLVFVDMSGDVLEPAATHMATPADRRDHATHPSRRRARKYLVCHVLVRVDMSDDVSEPTATHMATHSARRRARKRKTLRVMRSLASRAPRVSSRPAATRPRRIREYCGCYVGPLRSPHNSEQALRIRSQDSSRPRCLVTPDPWLLAPDSCPLFRDPSPTPPTVNPWRPRQPRRPRCPWSPNNYSPLAPNRSPLRPHTHTPTDRSPAHLSPHFAAASPPAHSLPSPTPAPTPRSTRTQSPPPASVHIPSPPTQ
jgi:hypothetical protein